MRRSQRLFKIIFDQRNLKMGLFESKSRSLHKNWQRRIKNFQNMRLWLKSNCQLRKYYKIWTKNCEFRSTQCPRTQSLKLKRWISKRSNLNLNEKRWENRIWHIVKKQMRLNTKRESWNQNSIWLRSWSMRSNLRSIESIDIEKTWRRRILNLKKSLESLKLRTKNFFINFIHETETLGLKFKNCLKT